MRSSTFPEILRVLLPEGTNRALDRLAAQGHTTRAEWVRRNLVMPAVKAKAVAEHERAA